MSGTIRLHVPAESQFGKEDFVSAPDLERLASRFTAEYPSHFAHIANVRLSILWKKKGGAYRGQPVLGKCTKASGLARFWGEVDFTIWLAADHLEVHREAFIGNCLFHELLHIGWDEEKERAIPVAHDTELFFAEVAERGLWKADLEAAHEVFTQLRLLPLEAAD